MNALVEQYNLNLEAKNVYKGMFLFSRYVCIISKFVIVVMCLTLDILNGFSEKSLLQ